VSRFLKELTGLEPTDIVVHYFLRDAEDLPAGGADPVLRNSELAVTLWIAIHRLVDKNGEASLVEHSKLPAARCPGSISPTFRHFRRWMISNTSSG